MYDIYLCIKCLKKLSKDAYTVTVPVHSSDHLIYFFVLLLYYSYYFVIFAVKPVKINIYSGLCTLTGDAF